MDQGILLLAYYSLVRVARASCSASPSARRSGFLLGVSPTLTRMFDPIMQVLRPISPLAWLPLGLVLFQKSEPAALFAIAVCSMWPTVINTMMGVRAIPQDYWNVAKVLRLSSSTTFTKIMVPATLPYMFTGYRLSLGIAWLVIVASEMLTGTPGVGGFLWQEYNSLVYAHILLAILTIGVVGFVLDRLMGWRSEAAGASKGRRGPLWRSSRFEVSPSRFRRRSGTRQVLRDVSLDVEQGEFVSIVGAMGQRQVDAAQPAGRPDDARRRHGRDRRRAGHAARRDAAFVFQNYSLLPWFTALENVRLAVEAAFPELTRDEQRARRARSSRSGSATRSTGGRGSCRAACGQRVAIARAFATEPQVLFLDEPFGALDALTRETLQQELARICAAEGERPVTTVMITNNVEEAILLSDRIVPMLSGPPATLWARRFRWSCRGRAALAQLDHDEQATQVRAHVVSTLTALTAVDADERRAAGAAAPTAHGGVARRSPTLKPERPSRSS